MNYQDLESAFSKPRIGRFYHAIRADETTAINLYKLNIQLPKAIFGLLSVFEVLLRNQIDQFYKTHFGDENWLKNQCDLNGIFNDQKFQRYGFDTKTKVKTTIDLLGKRYNHDRLITELNFGFWTYMFAPIQFLVGGQRLHKIYINRTKGTTPKSIFKELDEIRKLRNRIAHHEPLCFNSQHELSVEHTKNKYHIIIKQTEWLGYEPEQLFLGLDDTKNYIEAIEIIKKHLW